MHVCSHYVLSHGRTDADADEDEDEDESEMQRDSRWFSPARCCSELGSRYHNKSALPWPMIHLPGRV
jgi:hypothetical protein